MPFQDLLFKHEGLVCSAFGLYVLAEWLRVHDIFGFVVSEVTFQGESWGKAVEKAKDSIHHH